MVLANCCEEKLFVPGLPWLLPIASSEGAALNVLVVDKARAAVVVLAPRDAYLGVLRINLSRPRPGRELDRPVEPAKYLIPVAMIPVDNWRVAVREISRLEI